MGKTGNYRVLKMPLRPSVTVAGELERFSRVCGWLWGHLAGLVDTGVINKSEVGRYTTVLRHVLPDDVGTVPSTMTSDVARRLSRTLYRGVQPRLGARDRGGVSLVLRDLRVERLNAKWARVLAPRAGWVKFRCTYPFELVASASAGRLKRDACGDWWLLLSVKDDRSSNRGETDHPSNAVGVDLGAGRHNAVVLAGNDGGVRRFSAVNAASDLGRKIARFKAVHARAQPGSERERQVSAHISRLYRRSVRVREAWLNHVAGVIARDYGTVCLEQLRVRAMHWDRGKSARQQNLIHRARLSRTTRVIAQKVEESGGVVVWVSSVNTSRECGRCGGWVSRSPDFRTVTCAACGVWDADVNAAKVILKRGLRHDHR